ncbi:MAG: hypothetical protein AAF561_12075, partial [Planctomycetota bacterium]
MPAIWTIKSESRDSRGSMEAGSSLIGITSLWAHYALRPVTLQPPNKSPTPNPSATLPLRDCTGAAMLLLIDNYDSFTYNLVQLL